MGLISRDRGWWGRQCPARPYGLTHAHDSKCADGHQSYQCCECGRLQLTDAELADEDREVLQEREPDPMTGCTVDHNSIKSALLIADGGEVRTRCPVCNVMVEPRYESIGANGGPSWGPGLGPLTPRQQARLRGYAGWHAFNGGDAGRLDA